MVYVSASTSCKMGQGMMDQDDASEGKVQMKVRLDRSLREFLESSAAERGVSINREIVDRLERSRKASSTTYDELMGGEVVAISDIIAMVLRQISDLARAVEPVARERGWLHSPYAFDQAARGVRAALEAFRPDGDLPKFNTPWVERVGENMAAHVLEMAAARQTSWARRVASKLEGIIDAAAAKFAAGATTESM